MAKIPEASTTGQRLSGIPGVSMGPRVNASDFDNGAKNVDALGRAVQGVGQVITNFGVRMYEEQAQNDARLEYTQYKQDVINQRDTVFNDYKGTMAYDIPKTVDEYSQSRANEATKRLKTPRARELFNQHRVDFDAHNNTLALQNSRAKSEQYRIESLDADSAQLLSDAANHPMDIPAVMNAMNRLKMNNAMKYEGKPPAFIEMENGKSVMAMAEAVSNTLATTKSPEEALSFLNISEIKSQLSPVQFKTLMQKQAKVIIGESKKQAETQARQLGIQLGETFDSVIEIERALYDHDKDIADIARTEAMRIQKARLAAGGDEEESEYMAMARDIAANATSEAEVYDAVDAVPNLSPKEKKELRAETLLRFNAGQKSRKADGEAAKAVAKSEMENAEAESVRVNAAAIAGNARDVADIQDITDNMPGVSETYRKKVYDAAVARLKVKQVRQAQERADAETQAIAEMEKSGWDPAAISGSWPAELQEKMRDLAGKNRRADPVKALEYSAMSAEQLQQLVHDGQWPEVALHLKGVSTEMYNQVAKKAFGSKDGSAAGIKELRNPLQYGRDEFLKVTEIDPATAKGKQSYLQFLPLYENILREKALELGLDDMAKVPREDQKKAVAYLLQNGKFADDVWYWPFSKVNTERRRYQVLNDPNADIQNFTPSSGQLGISSVGGSAGTVISRAQVPSYAQHLLGERDKEIRLYPDDKVAIITQNGGLVYAQPGKAPIYRDAAQEPSLNHQQPNDWNFAFNGMRTYTR